MRTKLLLTALLFLSQIIWASSPLTGTAEAGKAQENPATLTLKVQNQYLNLPIRESDPVQRLTFTAKGMEDLSNQVKLASPGSSADEYWVFYDISAYKGKTLTITYEGSQAALDRIYQSDEIRDSGTFRKEAMRPQQHFNFSRGWNNDPNGLIYHEGEYHLFGQLNPFEANWNNMHWGHAVSTDLVHWKELPIALYPDNLGSMYSGTMVLDKDNTSGLGKKAAAPMVAIYTAQGTDATVCLAYSLDKGRTWTKYEGNPVLDLGDVNRDPKVFWYEEGGHWVMVLYERDGHSFFTSHDLKEWKYESHIAGFYECPDFYPLPVDGNTANTKWVLTAASGVYLVGSFDGKTFTPETGLQRYCQGIIYAGQTFNEMPDGRVVQIGWIQSTYPGMPFKGSFSTPLEMSLRSTKDGVRLFAQPAKEFEVLQHLSFEDDYLTPEEANEILKRFDGNDHLRIRCTMSAPISGTLFGLSQGGQEFFKIEPGRCFVNDQFVPAIFDDHISYTSDIILDKGAIEVYVNDGAFCQFQKRERTSNEGYKTFGDFNIDHLEIYTLDSIWDK